MVYPTSTGLAVADEVTRAAAKARIRRLGAHGGTAIGRWLRLAGRLLATRPDAIGHAILLTDGRNESEPRADLDAAVAACGDRVTVDCRAIGPATGVPEWSRDELPYLAEA